MRVTHVVVFAVIGTLIVVNLMLMIKAVRVDAATAPLSSAPRYQLSCVADGYEPGAICYRLDTVTGEVVRVDDGAAPFPAKTDSFGVIYGR